MTITCPHCGTEYDAEKSEYGRFVKCEICQKGFVAGTSMRGAKEEVRNVTPPVRTPVRTTSSTTYGVATGPRWITIHGYREWFLWRNPVRVFRNSGQTPICEVPHDADVAILAQSGDALRFRWEGPLGWCRRECQLVVGDCNDVFLSFRDRKDWILCATATTDTEGVFGETVRKNAWVKILTLVVAVVLVALLIVVVADDKAVKLREMQWLKFLLIGPVLFMKKEQWRAIVSNLMVRRIAVVAIIVTAVAVGVSVASKNNMPNDAGTGDMQPERRSQDGQSLSPPPSYSVPDVPARPSYTTTGNNHPANAKEAIRSARENVKRRYHQNLERLYLAESLYYERENMCELILIHPSGDSTLYHIRYWKSSNQLEWSRSIPKYVAEQFISDRMLISDYTKVLEATP